MSALVQHSTLPDAVKHHPKGADTAVDGQVYISDGAGGGTFQNLPAVVTDHGALTGLADDDHTQYLTEARHDALPSDNPHSVTAAQAGADPSGSAAAAQMAAIAAAAAALSTHATNTSNPHAVTAAQVGAADAAHTHSELHNPAGTETPLVVTGTNQVLISDDQTYQLNIQNPVMDPAKGVAILMRGTNVSGTSFDFGTVANVNQKMVMAATSSPTADTAHIAIANNGDVDLAAYDSTRDDGAVDLNRVAYFDAAGVIQVGTITVPPPDMVRRVIDWGGRIYGYTNNRWVYPSVAFGFSTENINANGGIGTDPSINYNRKGFIIEEGTILDSIVISGETNNAEMVNMDVFVRIHEADPVDPDLAIDTDTEILASTLTHVVDAFVYNIGNLQDYREATIDLGAFVCTTRTRLLMYFKPKGTITATRYYYAEGVINARIPV